MKLLGPFFAIFSCVWFSVALALLAAVAARRTVACIPDVSGGPSFGSLTDTQGLPVSGATVRLLRRADSSRREVKTDDQGHFTFDGIGPGEYRLTAEFSGFPPIDRVLTGRFTLKYACSPLNRSFFEQCIMNN